MGPAPAQPEHVNRIVDRDLGDELLWTVALIHKRDNVSGVAPICDASFLLKGRWTALPNPSGFMFCSNQLANLSPAGRKPLILHSFMTRRYIKPFRLPPFAPA